MENNFLKFILIVYQSYIVWTVQGSRQFVSSESNLDSKKSKSNIEVNFCFYDTIQLHLSILDEKNDLFSSNFSQVK